MLPGTGGPPSRWYVLGTDGDDRFVGYEGPHAVVWRHGRVITLPGSYAQALDVNRAGVVVGTVSADDGDRVPVFWRDGVAVPLAEPPGLSVMEVTGISDTGVIAGNAWLFVGDGNVVSHGLVWSVDHPETIRDLTPPGSSLWLYGISESGVLVGTVNPYGVVQRAVSGTLGSGLRYLPGTASGVSTYALAAAGRYVVGGQTDQEHPERNRPLLWADGRPRALPGDGAARAVNIRGLVAGATLDHPWTWQNGHVRDLDPNAYIIGVTEGGEILGNLDGATLWTCPHRLPMLRFS